jgi:membrane peptidoglycan carboxypeptidase
MSSRTDPPSRPALRRHVTDRWSFKPVALLLLIPAILAAGALVAVVIAAPFLAAGYGVREVDRRLTAAGADFTRIPRLPQRSTIFANDGKTVLARLYTAPPVNGDQGSTGGSNREIVGLNEVSPIARKAVLAIEDSTFYEHGALNVSSLFRALVENARAGSVVQGGSTITQQLVKNTLGFDPNDKSFTRKFQELALALRVEQKYTKDQIFDLYLNQVYLGHGVYGIGTAAQYYFHEPASKLSLAQGALLAGMFRAPGYYDPVARPHKALLRRNDVMNRMMSLGWVPNTRGERAKQTPLGLAKNLDAFTLPKPPFLVDYLRDQIIEDPNGWYTALGATPEARQEALVEGGLKIVSTLDPKWQRDAQRVANEPWSRWPEPPPGGAPADVGLVALDVKTGAIRTMLSGRHYKQDQTNTVTTSHQPGSSFKPFILAAAFAQGIPPTARYSGVQGPIDDPRCETNGQPWVVINAEGTSTGDLDLYQATTDSVNAVFAHLILDVGPENVASMAQLMGVRSPLLPYCSLATGSEGVTPLDEASGYQTLANGGRHCEPYAVQEIRRGDDILFEHTPDCEHVVKQALAELVTVLLKGPVTSGTAADVFASGWGPWPIAGKTGTADLNKAVWFTGYTRQVVTSVWVGSRGRPYELRDRYGSDLFGSSIAAPIWKAFMLDVMQGYRPIEFPEPILPDVPSVVGMQEDAARKTLRAAHFKVTSEVVGSYLPQGTVVSQDPAGGTTTIPGVTVTIQVSNGVAPVIKLPDLVGLTAQEATAQLSALHLFVDVQRRDVHNDKNVGIVLNQDPAAGKQLAEGSTVTIVVGSKPGAGGNGNGNGNGGGGGGGG